MNPAGSETSRYTAASRFSAAAVADNKVQNAVNAHMYVLEAAAAQAAEKVSCSHTVRGALIKSTCCGLDGCVAGHKSMPSI